MPSNPSRAALERLLDLVLRFPRLVLAATFALAALGAAGLGGLGVTSDMRAYFSEDNPQLARYEALEAVFGSQDNLLLLVVPASGDVFTPSTLALVRELTELGWQVPHAHRVDSLANHQHSRAEGDTLHIDALIPADGPIGADAARRARAVALAEPSLAGRVVARDGSATAINVTLGLPAGARHANETVLEWARARVASLRARHPDVAILIGGTTATNAALGEAVERDIRELVTLSYVIIVAGLLLLLRHLGGTIATVLVITLSVAATMGIFGWLGSTLAAVAGFVPSVVMTIAVADSVHVLTSYYYELRRGVARREAVAESMRINAQPILITSLTTMIGVLTLNFSDSPPYRDLGNMVAVGVAVAYVLSMTFLPALLVILPAGNPSSGVGLERVTTAVAQLVVQHPRLLLAGTGTVVVVLACFIPRNVLTERWHEYFDETFEVRGTVDAVDRHLGGLHVLRYVVDSGSDGGATTPAYLERLDAFADSLRAEPGVNHVAHLGDVVRRLNRNLHGDDPGFNRIPSARDLVAQYLLLFELGLPQGLGLDNLLDVSHRASMLVAVVKRTDSDRLVALDARARAWAARNAPEWGSIEASGVDMMFAHINHRNIRGLLVGMAFALVIISALLVFALRSWRLGALSLLTNLAPAGLAYGAWGIAVGRIDLSASVVMCMSLGIVVDDTVHFLSKYRFARRQRGLDVPDALRYAFNTVGTALLITSAVLIAGFAVLAFSHFDPSVTTGLLLSSTLLFALVVDFLLMPPLLLELDRRFDLKI